VSELWIYDDAVATWTYIAPPFAGAMWPMRRVFHSAVAFTQFVTADMMPVVSAYVASAQSYFDGEVDKFTNPNLVRLPS
jgi:hypothetical protein